MQPANSTHRLHSASTLMALSALLFVSACAKKAPEAPPAMPPQEVQVEAVKAATVPVTFEFVGNVQAYRRVEVRSSVAGIITARRFTEGTEVKAGEVLYEIDRTRYTATAQSADARVKNAEKLVNRLRPLLADKAIAQKDFDDAETELLRARADYDRAKKDLDDATVHAEISGRVGKTNLDLGARVTGPGDLLTTIEQIDPIYVSFRPSTEQVLAWRQTPASAALLSPGSRMGINVALPDGSSLPTKGVLDFVDQMLDVGTGTQEFRAKFANGNRILVPGQFVRVTLSGFQTANAITVPQRAVQQQMGRMVVYTVGAGDTVHVVDVVPGSWTGDRWIITKGLKVGDRVLVDGLQKTGPGAVVKPVEGGAAPAPAGGAAAPAKPAPAKGDSGK